MTPLRRATPYDPPPAVCRSSATPPCMQGEHKVCRTSCAAYAASFLARFAPLPLSDVVACVQRLAEFCAAYGTSVGAPPRSASPRKRASADTSFAQPMPLARRATMPALTSAAPAVHPVRRQASSTIVAPEPPDWERHEVFYAACQAAMYSLCYHMHILDEEPQDKVTATACAGLRKVVAHSMVPLMASDLQPLDVCLPTVSREFVRQVARHRLGALPAPAVAADVMTRHSGAAAFEMFFPFDPYLLPVSAPALDLSATFRAWRGGHVVPDTAAEAAAATVEADADEDDDTDTRGGDGSSGEEESQSESGDDDEVFGTSAPSDSGRAAQSGGRDIAGGRRKVYDVNPFAAAAGAAPMSMDDRGQYDDMMHAFASGSSPAGNQWLGQSPETQGVPFVGVQPAGGLGGEAMSLTEEVPWAQMHGCRDGQGRREGAGLVEARTGSAVGCSVQGRRASP